MLFRCRNIVKRGAYIRRWVRGFDGDDALRRRHRGQSGYAGLADVALGVAVAGLAIPAVIAMVSQQTQDVQDQMIAQQLKAVTEAGSAYVRDNFNTLYDNAVDLVRVSDLVTGGYLPSNSSALNALKQTQRVLLRRVSPSAACGVPPVPNNGTCARMLEALIITSDGTALTQTRASKIAGLAGASAGMVVDGETTRGAYNTWCIPTDEFRQVPTNAATQCTGGADPRPKATNAINAAIADGAVSVISPGHVAAAVFINGSGVTGSGFLTNALIRYNTGFPDDNTMHTDINVNGQNLNNVVALNGNQSNDTGVVNTNAITVSKSDNTGLITTNNLTATKPDNTGLITANSVTANQDVLLAGTNAGGTAYNVAMSQGMVYSSTVVGTGSPVTMPTCPGSLTPAAYAAPISYIGGTVIADPTINGNAVGAWGMSTTGLPISSVQGFVDTSSGTPTARIDVLTQDPRPLSTDPTQYFSGGVWSTVAPGAGQMIVMTRCQ